MELSRAELLDIYARVSPSILKTPLIYSHCLSELSGGDVYLKLENLQRTHSFKARGAFYKLSLLTEAERKKGVMTISAGNHGKAVAYFGQKLGIPVMVTMPKTASHVKIDACKKYGAEVHFFGNHLSESFEFGYALAKEKSVPVIHPYDDEDIIRGQSTLGTELAQQLDHAPDAVIVPVGGGGLASGLCLARNIFWKNTKIMGVQSDFAPQMAELLFPQQKNYAHAKEKNISSIAEGIAVKTPGVLTQKILKDNLDHIYVSAESKISEAVHYALMTEKIVLEGAGAAGIAAFLANPEGFSKQRVVIILCGGNVDPSFLRTLLVG